MEVGDGVLRAADALCWWLRLGGEHLFCGLSLLDNIDHGQAMLCFLRLIFYQVLDNLLVS